MNLSFDQCTLANLSTLVEISRSTFIRAFKKDNNPNDFSHYVNNAFSVENVKTELLHPNTTFYFAYKENKLVGYFKMNEKDAQNERFSEKSMELERIYVVSKFQGQSIGKDLLNKAINIAKSKEVNFLWLGVWEKNIDAIRFYERYHFKKFGTHPYYIGRDKQMDLLMKLDFV